MSFLVLLFVAACGGGSTVLTPSFKFFVSFGNARGQIGLAAITNDRMPIAESFAVHEDYMAMIEPTSNRLLVFSTDGKLAIDRQLGKIETGEGGMWSRQLLLAVTGAGTAFTATAGGDSEKRSYQIDLIRDEKAKAERIITLKQSATELTFKDRTESRRPLLQKIVPAGTDLLLAVWQSVIKRQYSSGKSDEILSVTSFDIVDTAAKKATSYKLDFSKLQETESGESRFDAVVSLHEFTDTTKSLVEVQYRKPDIRDPYEKALFVLDNAGGEYKKIDLPWSAWNSFLGIARDGTLFFLENVVLHKDTTRAIICLYRMDNGKEMRYAIEANPQRPAMGTFVFSRDGSLYSYEVFERGVNFFNWK